MATNLHLPPTMILPPDFEAEILPFIDETSPTPKETLIIRLLESSWHKANVRSILNFLFGINATLFFKVGNRIEFC